MAKMETKWKHNGSEFSLLEQWLYPFLSVLHCGATDLFAFRDMLQRPLCVKAQNRFQVGALGASPLALSELSSPAPALLNLSTSESFAHSLLFFLIQVLILQSQIIPILRIFCSYIISHFYLCPFFDY